MSETTETVRTYGLKNTVRRIRLPLTSRLTPSASASPNTTSVGTVRTTKTTVALTDRQNSGSLTIRT